jgi:hypothetical protein
MMLFRRLAVFLFNRRVARLRSGMAPVEIRRALGDPDDVEEATVPAGSGVGLQDCFAIKLAPGDRYLQWRYRRGDQHYYLWFAQDERAGDWRLSSKADWPAIVDASSA